MEEIIAARSTEPDDEPPGRESAPDTEQVSPVHLTPLVHSTHSLLPNTTQPNVLPAPPNVNPEARDAFNTPLRDAPDISANLPGLQTELPKDGPSSKRRRFARRQNSRSMPQ
eukprot:scaffold115043_cov19-Tisochrysis_lutea.AAC.1